MVMFLLTCVGLPVVGIVAVPRLLLSVGCGNSSKSCGQNSASSSADKLISPINRKAESKLQH